MSYVYHQPQVIGTINGRFNLIDKNITSPGVKKTTKGQVIIQLKFHLYHKIVIINSI